MTRADQRQLLEAFSSDYARELHNLLAADLGRFPAFVFQQLYNRLQWRVTEGEAAERITAEAARRCAPGARPWLHLRTRRRESEALIRTFAGHTGNVYACAFSPDGRRIVSGSGDDTLKLWDAETGRCNATFEGHDDLVNSCAFSPDGRRVVSGAGYRYTSVDRDGRDKTLKIWDAETGACEATLEGHTSGVTSCAFSPDGRRIVSASEDRTLKLWDVESGACEATLEGHGDVVEACAFSPDGRRIASGSRDKTLKLWDAEAGDCEPTVEGHGGRVLACAFSPDGRRIVSASNDGTLMLWDAETGARQATLETHHNSVQACAFSPGGRRVASGNGDPDLWDAETGRRETTLGGDGISSVEACAFSPDGRRIVSASRDGTLKLWGVESGACEATLEGHGWTVAACAFLPDGRGIVSGHGDLTLRLWDADTASEVSHMPTLYAVPCVAAHPACPRLAFGDAAGTVSVVDVRGLEQSGTA